MLLAACTESKPDRSLAAEIIIEMLYAVCVWGHPDGSIALQA